MNYKKFPFIGKLYSKLETRFSSLESSIQILNIENINLRLRLKKTNSEKINVVFICHRPAVWGSLKTVYESMKNDDLFNPIILAIPNKKQLPDLGLNHEVYESEGAETFWEKFDTVNGYDYKRKEWSDIRTLKPDYVFIQQPYNVCKPYSLKSSSLFKLAKLCYISYFTFLANKKDDSVNDECNPIDFLKDLSFYFTQSKYDSEYVKKRISQSNNEICKIIQTGFPCFDNRVVQNDESNWNFPSKQSFRLIWTPRWCTNEGNCNFFDYKDLLINYCNNDENIDFIFRPHPQAFKNWLATGEMTEKQVNDFYDIFDNSKNMKIDTRKSYVETFKSSSCLITDMSSIIPEYFLTGKPIIFCNKQNSKNTFIKNQGYTSGFYWVENWKELKTTLDMLKSGNDPLKEKRLELINSEFFIPKEGAGFLIKEAIKNDYLNA